MQYVWRICPGTHTLGRSGDADVFVGHRSVSRLHAEIVCDKDTVHIRDLGSQNGTHVNERRVERATLHIGDCVRIGTVAMELVDTLSPDAVPFEQDWNTPAIPKEHVDRLASYRELLSPFDCKVLELLIEGLTEEEAAVRLGIAQSTVHWHVQEIYKALNVCNIRQLMALFIPHEPVRKERRE